MNDADIPILKKTYELYKLFHEYRKVVSKANRFTIYERCENLLIDIIEAFLEAGYAKTANKVLILDKASVKLNALRMFIRLMKETHVIDMKKYLAIQEMIDEIGRMLGGWIRSSSH
jgi:hypothetical protein